MQIESGMSGMIWIDAPVLNLQEQRELLEWFKANRKDLFNEVATTPSQL